MAKKEMKYYLRKSAFGLASVSAALLVGTASVSAAPTTRAAKEKAKSEATVKLAALEAQYPELASEIASAREKLANTDLIQVEDIQKLVAETTQSVTVKAEAERQRRAEEEAARRLEEAANEALRKEKSTVIYIFGSKQGMTLPQELLDAAKMPESVVVKKGEKVPLPTFGNVRTATGEWRFTGWSRYTNDGETKLTEGYTAPGDGDITLIGDWEFVPFNANVLVSYVDTEGNVLGETVAVSQGLPGEAYDTTSLRLDKIEKDGKVYKFKKLQEGSPSETGTTLEGDLRVVYVYEEV
ncbi:TPA: MucBP domain-containing protein, partial [Streptococcus equi subsp. zooepidemicus]|nr:MucBP domain-containing protein [Streptococcus equi subsp. zooepidemicus]HEL0006474.1 MucBP domain-containing protein [Streptococcus equi subsp. zooepidemicus]HEL0067158.1 MucBP domain-containing protein [Streptococcus equi subsp. zooepidemicus]HEL0075406.1 MucBP domain-containing protein [Streptococcus equi subsp. zooepidemicus]HEL0089437.1 MucBP domain-containing protein [Streptococcus equi subsp. zooepidemicus]